MYLCFSSVNFFPTSEEPIQYTNSECTQEHVRTCFVMQWHKTKQKTDIEDLKGAQALDTHHRICQHSNPVWEDEKIKTFYKFWPNILHFYF